MPPTDHLRGSLRGCVFKGLGVWVSDFLVFFFMGCIQGVKWILFHGLGWMDENDMVEGLDPGGKEEGWRERRRRRV